MRTAVIVLVLALSGCAGFYDSSYWRNPATGDVVECEASWKDEVPTGEHALYVRRRCENDMQRAGLKLMPRSEGKAWEATR